MSEQQGAGTLGPAAPAAPGAPAPLQLLRITREKNDSSSCRTAGDEAGR